MDGLGGEGCAEGRFLSADMALFDTDWECGDPALVGFGDGQRRPPDRVDGVGDLYLELTSLVRGRRVVAALFFSARAKGNLLAVCLCNPCSCSDTSIQNDQDSLH